ncbi:hypothetical protein [Glycomyces tarimensis]
MWTELSPGDHVIEVTAPHSPMPVADEAPAETRRTAFSVQHGRRTALAFRVDVYAAPDPTDRCLHAWRCVIEEASVTGSEAGLDQGCYRVREDSPQPRRGERTHE